MRGWAIIYIFGHSNPLESKHSSSIDATIDVDDKHISGLPQAAAGIW
jgi:hypothetical protein